MYDLPEVFRRGPHAGSVEKTIRCGCLPMVKHINIVRRNTAQSSTRRCCVKTIREMQSAGQFSSFKWQKLKGLM